MIDRLLNLLAAVQTRIAAGFAMLVALATFLAPDKGWTPEIVPALGLAAAVSLWLLSELRSVAHRHPYDVKLATKILDAIKQPERGLIRSMDFAEDFQWTDFPGLVKVGKFWTAEEHQFLDRALQKRWAKLYAHIFEFREELARRSAPKTGAGDWYSVKTGRPDREGEEMSERAQRDADYLNAAASTLIKQLDGFRHYAIKRLELDDG